MYDSADGLEAQRRAFTYSAAWDGPDNWPPLITDTAIIATSITGTLELRAHVLDDSGVSHVWATIFPPSYQPAAPGDELVLEPLQTVLLVSQGGNQYAASYPGFTAPGTYRIVMVADDAQEAQSAPAVAYADVGLRMYLPVLVR